MTDHVKNLWARAEEIGCGGQFDRPATMFEMREAALEIERLREVVETAKRWRRAFHHGTREEIDLQEQCLLQALDIADEQTTTETK